MTRPAPINAIRFSLRTLLIVLLLVPPLVGVTWAVWHFMLSHIVTIERLGP